MNRPASSRRPLPRLPGLPWIGNPLQMWGDRLLFHLERHTPRLGPMFEFQALGKRALCVSGLDEVQEALKARPQRFRRVSAVERIARELGVHGVFSAEGEDWQRQRRLMKSAFSRRSITRAFGSIPRVTRRLLTRLDRQGEAPVLFRREVMRYTADVTSLLVFGEDLNTVERPSALQAQIEVVFEGLARRLFAPLPYWRYVKTRGTRATEEAAEQIKRMMLEVIRRRQEGARGQAATLLDAMLEARDAEAFTDAELYGNVFTLLLAGEDTTANGLAWSALYLAGRPDLQRALRGEARAVLGGRDAVDSLDELGALPRAQAVFKETLRLRGAAPLIIIEACEDTTLGGHPVAKGTPVFVMTRMLACDPAYFTEPEAFLPDRWDPAFVEARPGWRHELGAFLPFGAGPRTCIGAQLSIIEAQTLLSALCNRYELALITPRHAIEQRMGFVLHPSRFELRLTRVEA